MLSLALLAALALPHGGQYLPPAPDPAIDADRPGVPFTQPGSGPNLTFEAGRWEWWFEFNEEFVIRTRERLRALGDDEPVTEEDRLRVLLPVCVDALRSGQRDVRATAAMSLARLRLPDALPFIEVAAEDPDLFVRTQATLALGVSGLGAAVEPLSQLLADRRKSAEEHTFAAAALGLLGTPEAIAVLTAATSPRRLARAGYQMQAALVYALGLTDSPAGVVAIKRLLASNLGQSEAGLQALAGVALGQLGRPEGLAPLMGLLGAADNQVRRSAGSGLAGLAGWLTDDDLTAILEQYERESDLPTRANLLRALGHVRSERSREFLVKTLERTPTLLRPHAAMALGLDGDPSLVQPLLEVLDDQHELSLRAALLVALGLVGSPEAGETLRLEVGQARDPALQGYLCLAIGLHGRADEETLEVMTEWASSSPEGELVRYATLGLGLLGERAALATLASTIDDVRSTVQRAARLYALGQVGDRALLDDLAAVPSDEYQPSYVRTYAVQALGNLGDPRTYSPLARLSHRVDLDHEMGFVFELYQLF